MLESAKSTVLNPLLIAMNVARAETPAEWELGMPPVSKKVVHSHLPVRLYLIGIFMNCASMIALRAIFSALFNSITSYLVFNGTGTCMQHIYCAKKEN